jgi:antitoxin component YwqK of YwqJK toxin-antitoxin module
MKKVFIFGVIAVVISHCGVISHEKIEEKPNRVEVISNWGDGTVKEERIYLDGDVVEIMTYFENFKVNTKGRVKIVGEEEVRIGTWRSYYKNGTHWSQGEYSNGVSDGGYQTWYPNGNPNIIGFYSNGVETGQWTFFDSTGTVVKQYDVTPG